MGKREDQVSEMSADIQVAAEAAASGSALVEEAAEEARVRVILHNQEGSPGGMDDVFVSVNGRAYQIKREQEVDLPAGVLHALDNAVAEVMNNDGTMRPAKRFNYSMVRRVA